MKQIFLFFLLFFTCYKSFNQNIINNDTINSNIIVKFNKVKPSFKEANTSSMQSSYIPQIKSVLINFEVPSFNFRLNTSLTDYCIVTSGYEELKFQNKVEAKVKEADQNIYSFIFVISKDSLIKILSSNIKKITFYFTPNEKKITEYLSENAHMSDKIKKYFIKLSKKTIKYSVSKPDTVQYKNLISWLDKL